MNYLLYVIMFLHDGTRVDHVYPDQFRYSECMTFARQEAAAMGKEDTSWAKNIEFYCGTEEDFEREWGR